jgi:hypothetical protein
MVRINTAGLLPERPAAAAATQIAESESVKSQAAGITSNAAQDVVSDVVSPIDGQIVDGNDIDGLITLYERLDAHDKEVYAAKLHIRQLLQGMSEGDGSTKTRRVRGKHRQAKIEMPDDSWDQSVLKEAFFAFPQFRDEFIRIDRLAPKMKEVKKLANMSGADDLRTFRDMLLAANRGPSGVATIKIEK